MVCRRNPFWTTYGSSAKRGKECKELLFLSSRPQYFFFAISQYFLPSLNIFCRKDLNICVCHILTLNLFTGCTTICFCYISSLNMSISPASSLSSWSVLKLKSPLKAALDKTSFPASLSDNNDEPFKLTWPFTTYNNLDACTEIFHFFPQKFLSRSTDQWVSDVFRVKTKYI